MDVPTTDFVNFSTISPRTAFQAGIDNASIWFKTADATNNAVNLSSGAVATLPDTEQCIPLAAKIVLG